MKPTAKDLSSEMRQEPMKTNCQESPGLRLLVVIASFGVRNLELLKRIIARYKAMTLDVDVVVHSDAPRELGDGVEVLVELPTKHRWSLQFAHKAVLASKLDQYDLFAYSEDDMEVTEENIRAFLRATPRLAPDEIAGYLRYETNESGKRSLPEVHGCFRWKPESVQRRGSSVVAEFTNEHAAFFLLTRDQLRRAIASGGFMRAPYQGRYDAPCSAATDPYTNCGFRKVVCVSELESFLIHHASNRYFGALGLPLEAFEEQVKAVIEICDGSRPAKTLCEVEPKVLHFYSKILYDKPGREWLDAVPKEARTVLSVGCGWGAFEAEIQRRGAAVTALAMDSVIGAAAERLGLHVIHGTLEEGLQTLQGKQFDCVFISHLLHLLPNPNHIVEVCCRLVRPGGRLLLGGPNFNRLSVLLKRVFLNGDYGKLRSFADSGMTVCGPSTIAKTLGQAGFHISAVRWLTHASLLGKRLAPGVEIGSLTAADWMLESVR